MTVLSADSLRVRAADGTDLLSDVSLAVEPGETVLVCGRSGSGKTLLLKALEGLLDDRDDLRVGGTVRREGPIGYVFQRPATQLVRRVVRRDAAFGLENRGVPPEEIEARIDRHADRLDATHLLDRPVRDLSGGETAIVAILGVLVTEPGAVLLDEPLASLDHPNARLVLEAIDRLREAGAAVVIAEHDVRDLLCRADRAVLLDDGEVAARGAPEELAPGLRDAGVALPFATEVALALASDGEDVAVPLAPDGMEVGPE